MDTWLPNLANLAVALATIIGGLLTLHRLRVRRQERPPNTTTGSPLNGYAAILKNALDRLEYLRERWDEERRRNDELVRRNRELEVRLDEEREYNGRREGVKPSRRRRPTSDASQAAQPPARRSPRPARRQI